MLVKTSLQSTAREKRKQGKLKATGSNGEERPLLTSVKGKINKRP